MAKLRLVLSVCAVAGLMGGYLASQSAYGLVPGMDGLFNTPADYAAAVDRPLVRMLALAVFLAAIALSLIRSKEPGSE